MPRAEAGTRADLPSLERWSFDLAPFTNCLQKWELDNFLVFHLFPVAYFQGFICYWEIYLSCTDSLFVYVHLMLISTPCWLAKTDSPVDGEPQGVLEAEFKLWRCDCKLSFPFRPAVRVPRESLLTSNGDQRTLRLLCRILGLMFDSLTIFCADMEPLSKYSPVMLQFSPATVILIENPGVGWWWSEILTYLFKVYVLTIFVIKISKYRHIFKVAP